ncbi:acyl-CoA dehydrogenase [Streptomyces sp. PTM05]|uniref:Acyl-CoA dehydrogenase n=1 Tax=Streptantibioticus parmotrematis TaxID=2873249 RepID=A0ABS7R0F6_9ACTN|nr:acyl-CoA dehydrogenase family protein [Streptantibioticus parmotrematis]MBY8888950.1 acyl-CoA dehydrogenase [Streptantibioticus parmotrematis]
MTEPSRSVLDRCEETAYDKGFATALALVLRDVDIAAAAPGAVVGVPEGWPVAGEAVDVPLATGWNSLAFVRLPKDRPADADACAAVVPRLARARIGLLRRTLDEAVAHLSARTSVGEPLLYKQLILGSVADTVTELQTLRRHADGLLLRPRPASAAYLHARIDRLDWRVCMLFGASGYITDHPATALYLSDLVANTWVRASGEGETAWN